MMASSVADLQKKFGISGSVEVAAGKSGSTVVGGREGAQMTLHMPPGAPCMGSPGKNGIFRVCR